MKRLLEYFIPLAKRRRLSALPYQGVRLIGRSRYIPYLVASAISLGADLGSFYLMLLMNLPAVEASMLAYALGLVVHWQLSAHLVFADKVHALAAGRRRQKVMFVISALAGLATTALVVNSGIQMGLEPGVSKLAAVVLSFHLTYLLRRTLVFA
jgi:putative flippase GtrA